MRRFRSAMVAAVLTAIAVPAAAQHWTFDARRIALGGAGAANRAGELVAERRGYGTIALPFGLFQSLSDLDVYRSIDDPAHPDFDPVRAIESLASPLHYTLARPQSPNLRAFLRDLTNDKLSSDLAVYQDITLSERILWEGLASPNWGKTFVVSGERDDVFQGFYIGAGPYLSFHTDTRIDPDLTATFARVAEANDVLANISFDSAHATMFQMAAAITGGYRARFPLPGHGALERDGIYVAVDYHKLLGFRFGQVDLAANFATDEAGLLVGVGNVAQVGFSDTVGSRSGGGHAVDLGTTVVMGRIDIGFSARGLGNRLNWTALEHDSDVIEIGTDSPLRPGSSPPVSVLPRDESELPDTLRIALPVHYSTDIAYHADGWSAFADYGHGFLGHRMQAGVELRRGWIELRGGGRFLRDRWHPSVGVGLNRSEGRSLDIALFGVSANVARKRTLAIAVSLRLDDDEPLGIFPGL